MRVFDDQKVSRVCRLIGAASGWGAQLRETEQAPILLQSLNIQGNLEEKGIHCAWSDMVYPLKNSTQISLSHGLETLPYILDHDLKVAEKVYESLEKGEFPCVIGGDHSIAVGTWSAVALNLKEKGRFGLIWIDAHMDAHTPTTSPSQAYHGMPVATLMGYGEEKLIHLIFRGAKIDPRDLVLVGIRSYEEEEAQLLKSLGVKIYTSEDVLMHGMDIVLSKAIKHVTENTHAFGVSIDLDVFDPEDAPGVGSPEPKGVRVTHAIEAFQQLKNHPSLAALEIVELNPTRDHNYKTAHLVYELLLRILPQ